MTLKEHWSRENTNRNRVYLVPEGVFYKAYECSAFILSTQWRPLAPSVKRVKYMGGEIVVSVGFPQASLPTLEAIMHRDDTYSPELSEEAAGVLAFSALHPVDEHEFLAWKAELAAEPSRDVEPEKKPASSATASATEIVERILSFPLENSSPVDCLLFLSELKRLAIQAYGKVR